MKTQLSTAGDAGPPPVADVLRAGDKAGPWVIERELGRGGMGTVYAVVHEEIGKRAALKVVHARLLVPGFNSDRMLLEAKVVNQVGHPNIVDIFETGRMPDSRPYIVMERLEGQPLSFRADDGKILPDQVIAILLQVCDALIAAHAAGVIHRDLKLDNVFLVDNPDDPTTPRVKLLDWGIAKVINHDVHHTVEGQLVGTPQYLSPEQARGAAVSGQTDVYSLGVMAYELFLEQLPFEAETSAEIMAMHLRATPPPASDLWPDIPPKLEELIHQMLAKSAEHRPTMLEVAHRLEAVREDLRARSRKAFLATPTRITGREAIVAESRPRTGSGSGPRVLPPVIAAAAPARGLSPGLAPTMPADFPTTPRRWQWAVGAIAIIASATMFLVTRNGDSAVAAAAEPVHAIAPAPEPMPAPQAITPPNIIADTAVVETVATNDSTATATAEPHVTTPRTPSRSSTRRSGGGGGGGSAAAVKMVSSRKGPAMPRRAVLVDPNGTLDPYQ